jgi:lipoyl(octanoyl) transferase
MNTSGMQLHILPTRNDSAAGNMAADFLLLQRYPQLEHVRLRHYGWQRPSFTFGYSQKLAWVREQLSGREPYELCRRPTGGGVVDHTGDWTYALVIPRGHALEERPAPQSYRVVHEALALALSSQGVPAVLKEPALEEAPHGPGLCYEQAEVHDVIRRDTGVKIAGAAQKRNKRGLLFQGYVWRGHARELTDWDLFFASFAGVLAGALGVPSLRVPWPEYAEGEHEALTEQYGSDEWMAHR